MLKAVVISDTHSRHTELDLVQDSDIRMIIHCGDFSDNEDEALEFINWYGALDYQYKILIAGNHDLFVEESVIGFKNLCKENDIIFLHDESIEIEGVKIYATPFNNEMEGQAFYKDRYEIQKLWDKIPDDTELLITHIPQYMVLDTVDEFDAGCDLLKKRIEELKSLKYHFFGHIHQSYGVHKSNHLTSFNASSCNHYQEELNKPEVFTLWG